MRESQFPKNYSLLQVIEAATPSFLNRSDFERRDLSRRLEETRDICLVLQLQIGESEESKNKAVDSLMNQVKERLMSRFRVSFDEAKSIVTASKLTVTELTENIEKDGLPADAKQRTLEVVTRIKKKLDGIATSLISEITTSEQPSSEMIERLVKIIEGQPCCEPPVLLKVAQKSQSVATEMEIEVGGDEEEEDESEESGEEESSEGEEESSQNHEE